MRYSEIINEGRDAIVYHGYGKPEYASMALVNNELAATTSQRFWADGKRRKDNDPEYQGSYWMKGISLTRDFNFALTWGRVVFAVDQTVIAQRYKIVPFNWGYSIPDRNNIHQDHKREREEFVVVKATPDTYQNPNGSGMIDMNRFRGAEGAVKPLSSFLRGIYVSTEVAQEDYFQNKMEADGFSVQQMIDHPLFKGYFDFAKRDGKIIPPGTELEQPPESKKRTSSVSSKLLRTAAEIPPPSFP